MTSAGDNDDEWEAELADGGHPYGVKPSGNALLDALSGVPSVRTSGGFGAFGRLSDELLFGLLGYLDGKDLARLAQVSRPLCVYASDPSLFRVLALTEFQPHELVFRPPPAGSTRPADGWKTVYVRSAAKKSGRLDVGNAFVPRPFPVQGLYSDTMFKAHVCQAARLEPRWLAKDNIPRRSADEGFTVEDFRREFEEPNLPVIIKGVVDKWPAFTRWNQEALVERHGDKTFSAGGFPFTLRDYFAYHSGVQEEQPLYLFDKHFGATCPDLAAEYSVPPYFDDDLFAALGPERPDYRWLIAGPEKSGSVWHKDPNCTSAWNACVTGAKKWIMFPPHWAPPGVHASADEGDVATTMTPLEWFIDFYDVTAKTVAQSLKKRKGEPLGDASGDAAPPPAKRRRKGMLGQMAAGAGASQAQQHGLGAASGALAAPPASHVPYEGICRAGEVIFVPAGWWHIVINVAEEPCIAITQNFASRVNLPHVLRFLRDKRHAVSGVCSDEAAATLYERFVAALQAAGHGAVLQAALEKINGGSPATGEADGEGSSCSSAGEDLSRAVAGAGAGTDAGAAAAVSEAGPSAPPVAEVTTRWSTLLGAGGSVFASSVGSATSDSAPSSGFSFGFEV